MSNSADRRLHHPGREPRLCRGDLPAGRHSEGRHDLHDRSASSRSPRTTSSATTPSRCRTTSPTSATKHSLTFGFSFEKYRSENVFFSGSQSVYTYSSLEDFYADANGYLQDPNRTASPVQLRRFQVRLEQHSGGRQAAPAARREVCRRLRPGRLDGDAATSSSSPASGSTCRSSPRPASRIRSPMRCRSATRRGRRSTTRPPSCRTRTSCGRRAPASTGI